MDIGKDQLNLALDMEFIITGLCAQLYKTPPGKHGYWKRSAEPSFGYGGHHKRLMRSAETLLGKYGYWKRSAEPSYGHGGHHRLMRSADGHGGSSYGIFSF